MAANATLNSTSSDPQWTATFHTPLTLLALITVFTNLPVLILYLKTSSLRHSAGNMFLVGLAVADLLCACVMIPTGMVCDLRVLKNDLHHQNTCIIHYVSSLTLSVASVYHIVAATAAKYFAIVYPMRNITIFTNALVNAIAVSIWIGSFLVGHVPFYMLYLTDEEINRIMRTYAIFLTAFAFAIPTLILTCIHVHIYVRLFLNSRRRALMNDTNTRSENHCRIAILFFLLFLFFVISWLPWYLQWNSLINVDHLTGEMLGLLRFLAAVLNPVMFTFVKRDFRKAALSTISGLRGRQRDFSSRRFTTQATSSVDRANYTEQQNIEITSRIVNPEPELQSSY